jgi:putative two-component system response regulator
MEKERRKNMVNFVDDRKLNNSHIMVVDDEEHVRKTLQEAIKRAGYECTVSGSGKEALKLLDQNNEIDVVITDIKMPGMNGIELLSRIKEQYNADVMVITGYSDEFGFEEVMEKGANDFIEKPLQIPELEIRLKRVLKERHLFQERNAAYESLEATNRQLLKYGKDLNETILDLKAAHKELQASYLDTIHRLVLASEYKDEDTGDHIVRMGRYSALLAEKLEIAPKEVENIHYAAPMHDVGKIGIPDNILLKPGKLTEDEFETMKTHTTIGSKILSNSKAQILQIADQIALSHHEKWNGKGYPKGISGTEIPLVGRIVSLADVFDALTSKRPYKAPFPVERAVAIIKEDRGQHFDPDVVDVFMENIDDILKIKADVGLSEEISFTDHNEGKRKAPDGFRKS